MNFKDRITEILLEGSLIVAGLLLIVAFFQVPDLPKPFYYWPRVIVLFIGIVIFNIGAILWARHFKKMKIPQKYRPSIEIKNKFLLNRSCDVLHAGSISIYDYSNYANGIKEKNKIFTVCAFEPNEILNHIYPRYNERLRGDNKPVLSDINGFNGLNDASFLEQADNDFPHFRNFRDFQVSGGNIERLLLLKDELALGRNPKWMFEKFLALNGHIPCNVAKRNILEKNGIVFLTDFVVYNEEFIMDYYSDSSTFILSYIKNRKNPVRHQLLALINHFQTNRNNRSIYIPLDDFIRTI